ncbi:sulfite exporter TauE/SafE family protein [Pelagibacteraceae bacterium]|nr:sulfite exporter TauE/SafE family protein [Candidatus Pelagibacter sp.]MDC1485498.1 sulfite exporter TauE/SafE family protein [Pelagibacteraceae bacterium]
MIILSILFFIIAILYSSVGFGGGSSYLALLLIWEIPYYIFPVIALSCNIIVVSGNCFNYSKAGNLNLRLLLPYIVGSMPLAFIGGSLPIEKRIFEILLFVVLTIAGFLLLFKFKLYDNKKIIYKKIPNIISIIIGGILGFISGVVGIGGGIFLSPILFLLKAGKPKHIITVASMFILINSIFGIFGQLTKNLVLSEIINYWFLFLAVFIGGQIGNFLNIKMLPTRILALITSGLVIFVAARMGFKLFL